MKEAGILERKTTAARRKVCRKGMRGSVRAVSWRATICKAPALSQEQKHCRSANSRSTVALGFQSLVESHVRFRMLTMVRMALNNLTAEHGIQLETRNFCPCRCIFRHHKRFDGSNVSHPGTCCEDDEPDLRSAQKRLLGCFMQMQTPVVRRMCRSKSLIVPPPVSFMHETRGMHSGDH